MFRRKTVIFAALLVVFTFLVTLQLLLTFLPATENDIKTNQKTEKEIYNIFKNLPDVYKLTPISDGRDIKKVELFLENIDEAVNFDLGETELKDLWNDVANWPSSNQITDMSSNNMGKLMNALKHATITRADIDSRGTQLKLLLTLTGGQQCVFKPKWYEKGKVIEGPVYAGKDRYGAEVVAFYLSVLLDKPLTPVSVERTLSLKYDILPVATKRLINTSFVRGDRACIYGKCFYCKKEDPICENESNLLTGAVILNVKRSFSNYRSPWQRTYKKGKKAAWELDPDYCKTVRNKLSKKRLMDLIDTAIFDFLMQNGDRHHYETLDELVIWLDNGKGLGNPYVQHIDVLAPLYQCCQIREKTWQSLLNLAGGNLSKYLKLMPDIKNVLTEEHLNAMEERLLLIFSTIEYCKRKISK